MFNSKGKPMIPDWWEEASRKVKVRAGSSYRTVNVGYHGGYYGGYYWPQYERDYEVARYLTNRFVRITDLIENMNIADKSPRLDLLLNSNITGNDIMIRAACRDGESGHKLWIDKTDKAELLIDMMNNIKSKKKLVKCIEDVRNPWGLDMIRINS